MNINSYEIRKILQQDGWINNINSINDDSVLLELEGLDSLALIGFISKLEEIYEISFSEENLSIKNFITITKILETLHNERKSKYE